VIVYLVRHARAGHRAEWQGDDRLRPLDERGGRQAQALIDQLSDRDFERILSSPYVRCVETVVPLAGARGLPVETDEALAEGAAADEALRLLRGAGEAVVACVHGDVAGELLGERLKKGATAVLEVTESGVQELERLPPPA
jgi:phosphohistidine phosphatase SixA